MEEWQDAEDFVVPAQHEYLRHLPDIGGDVAMREHHAFGIARAAAGEDDCGRSPSVQRFAPSAAFCRANGIIHAMRKATIFSTKRGFSSTSSSSSVRPGTSIFGKRSRNAFDVTVVCRLHWRPQEAITSLFAV